jgi:NitT/TauT family transport system substrate-binding protein
LQKTGTFAWELVVIRAHALDKQVDLSIEVIELANPRLARSRFARGTPTS